MQEGVKRALFSPSLFSYRSFSDLCCFLRKLMSSKLYLDPLSFLNEPPAAGGKGLPWPLMKPVNSRAVNYGWDAPSSLSQHGTDRTETQDNLPERREGTGREKNHMASWGHQREACNEPWSSTSQYRAEAPSQIWQLINFVSNLGQIGFAPFPLYKHGTFAPSFHSLHVGISYSVW